MFCGKDVVLETLYYCLSCSTTAVPCRSPHVLRRSTPISLFTGVPGVLSTAYFDAFVLLFCGKDVVNMVLPALLNQTVPCKLPHVLRATLHAHFIVLLGSLFFQPRTPPTPLPPPTPPPPKPPKPPMHGCLPTTAL